MPAELPKLVIVGKNCYVRLYLSPVRPILGSTFGGYASRLRVGSAFRMARTRVLFRGTQEGLQDGAWMRVVSVACAA